MSGLRRFLRVLVVSLVALAAVAAITEAMRFLGLAGHDIGYLFGALLGPSIVWLWLWLGERLAGGSA